MTPTFLPATDADLAELLTLMREFYALEQLPFDEDVAGRGVRQLLADPVLGAVYLIRSDKRVAGYFALGFNFSLEFHGRYAWIDELYVRGPLQGSGIGAAVLVFVEQLCRERGFAAVRLEVSRRNAAAERLYRRSGYEAYDRNLLTKWIQ